MWVGSNYYWIIEMNKAQLERELGKLRKALKDVENKLKSQVRFAGDEGHNLLKAHKSDVMKKIVNIENQLVIKV